MKRLFLIFLIIISSNCSDKILYHHGFIYDYHNKPLEGFKVASQFDININSITDNKGYFKITNNKALGADLIIYYKDRPIDTIVTVWSQHGEKLMYSFINEKSDTLKLKKYDLVTDHQ